MGWQKLRFKPPRRSAKKRPGSVPNLNYKKIDTLFRLNRVSTSPLLPGSYWLSPSGLLFLCRIGDRNVSHVEFALSKDVTLQELQDSGYIRIFYPDRYPAVDIRFEPTLRQFDTLEDFIIAYKSEKKGGLNPIIDIGGQERCYNIEDVKYYFGMA